MDPYQIIDKYYSEYPELKHILLTHSESVANKALAIAKAHPELGLDQEFLYQAALLHDVGIFKTHAPGIKCTGEYPYIAHGYLGAELLLFEGYPKHALVCERHTGTGISLEQIENQNLPLPRRNLQPISLEEQVICFADKFFSKSHIDQEKTIEQARNGLLKFGDQGVDIFDDWTKRFL